MQKHLFKIECITNMHVGSGDTNYNIIDNEVQKDPVLKDVPAIYASSVKGALREHFENEAKVNEDTVINNAVIDRIFGKDKEGEYKFFGAKLIARPLRVSAGNCAYVLTTAVDILKDFSDFLEGLGLSGYYSFDEKEFDFGVEEKERTFLSTNAGVTQIEGEKAGTFPASENLKRLLGDNIAVAKTLRDYDLPVVARNVLKDGKSDNVWYEEIVPHKSIFFFVIMTPENDNYSEDFIKEIQEKPVQFGGNSTIGFGYTTVKLIETESGEKSE